MLTLHEKRAGAAASAQHISVDCHLVDCFPLPVVSRCQGWYTFPNLFTSSIFMLFASPSQKGQWFQWKNSNTGGSPKTLSAINSFMGT